MEIDIQNENWLKETLLDIIESLNNGAKRVEYSHASKFPNHTTAIQTIEVTAYRMTENQIRIDVKVV